MSTVPLVSPSLDLLLRTLLELRAPTHEALETWWRAAEEQRTSFDTPVDRALLGGALADRVGFAFVGGYQAALEALFGPAPGITSLCVTEAAGNRPQDIATTLKQNASGSYVITGRKKWATAGPLAQTLLVAASTGTDDLGRNHLRMIRIPTNAKGVHIIPASVSFVPEIPHAEVELDGVIAGEADVLPGDGYADYIKPFRTVEDAHVHAALLGYVIGVARRIKVARDLIEQLLAAALAMRNVALADPRSPATHIALAGSLSQIAHVVGEVELRWEDSEGPEWTRWLRDRAIFRVAGAARAARREKAWSLIDHRS
jgi:acyl-CoA dehydrogenase